MTDDIDNDGTTLHESGGVVQPTDALNVLATFAHEVVMGAIAPSKLELFAIRALRRAGLSDLNAVLALAVPQAPLQAEPVPVVASEAAPARLVHALQHAKVASQLLMDAHAACPETWRGYYDDALTHVDIAVADLEVMANRATVSTPQPEPVAAPQPAPTPSDEHMRLVLDRIYRDVWSSFPSSNRLMRFGERVWHAAIAATPPSLPAVAVPSYPPIHHVHAERSYDQRVKAILAFNTCAGDLDDKLHAAWLASLNTAKVSRPSLPAAQAVEGVEAREAIAVLDFLSGVGELDGCGFGDKPEHERGNYWWRKHLPKVRAAIDLALAGGAAK